jgi:hypothetical protein
MDEFRHEQGTLMQEVAPASRRPLTRPRVSDAEREFWRRAVASERARQRCGRPAPFPFQDA